MVTVRSVLISVTMSSPHRNIFTKIRMYMHVNSFKISLFDLWLPIEVSGNYRFCRWSVFQSSSYFLRLIFTFLLSSSFLPHVHFKTFVFMGLELYCTALSSAICCLWDITWHLHTTRFAVKCTNDFTLPVRHGHNVFGHMEAITWVKCCLHYVWRIMSVFRCVYSEEDCLFVC